MLKNGSNLIIQLGMAENVIYIFIVLYAYTPDDGQRDRNIQCDYNNKTERLIVLA
jgi:hypothetical protein